MLCNYDYSPRPLKQVCNMTNSWPRTMENKGDKGIVVAGRTQPVLVRQFLLSLQCCCWPSGNFPEQFHQQVHILCYRVEENVRKLLLGQLNLISVSSDSV
ncbi:hypothetical protein XENORESO_012933 [Xenotaenia resolanae]|uniref:Uncharacterized protein n=1 Tax=Xenotaenia resolanae TaxID=208358 RepID=A0ABV0VZD4_9TELE